MDARSIATNAVERLKGNIQEAMEARGKNASGDTSRRIAVIASGGAGAGFGQGSLEADSQWKYVGNGRGPGAAPPINSIRKWIADRGLNLNAFAVAQKIARQGSRDFRLKRTNVFLDEVKAWEQVDVPKAEDELVKLKEQQINDIIDQVKFN